MIVILDFQQLIQIAFLTIDTGGDLSIDNPYGIIAIGGSITIGGNIQLYNVNILIIKLFLVLKIL